MPETKLTPATPDDLVVTAPAGHTAVLRNFNTDKTKVRIGFTPIVPPVDPPPVITPPPTTDPPVPDGFTTIQAAVNAQPVGAVIGIPAGLYRETVTPKAGQRLVPVGGSVRIDGQNSRQHAFVLSAADVTLDRGFAAGAMFEAFDHRPPYQRGAFYVISDRATIRGAFAHHNPGNGKGSGSGHDTIGGGIAISRGGGHLLEDVRVEDNETCGIHVNGFGDGTQAGLGAVTIRRAIVRNNNPGQYNLGWHSGGIKATKVDGWTVEDSDISGNKGDGLWGDIDVKNALLRRNRIDHNSFGGIHYEISDLATISDNVLWENGWARTDNWGWGASIQLVTCRRVNVTGNLVAWSNRGISLLGDVANRAGSYPVSKPGSYDAIVPSGNTVISSDGYLLFWGSGVPANVDATAKYWSAVAPVPSSGPTCVVNLTVAQRDAILTAAGIPLGRS